MKLAFVVHGRFHAFDLCRALLAMNHDAVILTNYPRWAASRFRLPRRVFRTFPFHGAISRVFWKLKQTTGYGYPERWLHQTFGAWAARTLMKERFDVIHSWSGVAEEVLKATATTGVIHTLLRGSAHILTQSEILEQELRRTGLDLDRPSPWIIAREQAEYSAADVIFTLSSFAYRSFLAHGVPAHKVRVLSLGVDTRAFRPTAEKIRKRVDRIRNKRVLNVLYVGAVSLQKGFYDLSRVIRHFSDNSEIRFTIAGPLLKETADLVHQLKDQARFLGKIPQPLLPDVYGDSDLFVFPTIHDGFAAVLTQASAAGLPVLTTTNCGGPDFVIEGKTGWIVPIRNPEALVARLEWCLSHREDLAAMAEEIPKLFVPRDWSDVARDFVTMCSDLIEDRRRHLA